ncbi:MAG: hypothetical protein IT290_05845 [Deltaproteobacteria bacterium]|nr:hypothetical protein [Deltaproteobacteria bacterium]
MRRQHVQHRGSALLVVLGISLLLSSIGGFYASTVFRAFAVERSLLVTLEERLTRSSDITRLLERIVNGEPLASHMLAGNAAVLTTVGPRLIALGHDLPRIVSERDALNGVRYPSWSELRRILPTHDCSDPAEPIGSGSVPASRGRSRVSCTTPPSAVRGGFATGNLEVANLTLESAGPEGVAAEDESAIVIAARGDIQIGELHIRCDAIRSVSIIATGHVEIGNLVPCATTPVELLIHSSGGFVSIGNLGIPDARAALCSKTAHSALSLGVQSALGARIAPLIPLPPGFRGCSLRRSASFWRRIKLVGEVS